MNNYLNAFEYRHEMNKKNDTYHVDDEIFKAAYDFIEELYDDESIDKHDAFLDYDNLAINAEIVEKDEAEAQYDKTPEELERDALFVTKNYIVLSW